MIRQEGARRQNTERAELQPSGIAGMVRITASIGVATLPTDAVTAAQLLERADAAMYHAKRNGRDGVSYYDTGNELRRVGLENTIQNPG